MRAYLGLGANLGRTHETFEMAIDRLDRPYTEVRRVAPLFGSRPLGPPGQPAYLNTVVEIDTALSPIALLAEVKAIERRFGRNGGGERWGPRPIDVDVLLYGDRRIDTAVLTVPHQHIAARRFVLAPLAALSPELVVPRHDATVRALLDQLADDPESVWLDTGSVGRGSSAS